MSSRPSDPRSRPVPRPVDPRIRPAGHDARTPSVPPPQAVLSASKQDWKDEQAVIDQLVNDPSSGSSSSSSSSLGHHLKASCPGPFYVSPSPLPAPTRSSTDPRPPAFWQVVPRRPLNRSEEAQVRAIRARLPRRRLNFDYLPLEFRARVLELALEWEVDPDYELGTVDAIFLMVKTAKACARVCKAWRPIAEQALYETACIFLPRVSPNLSGFTAWLKEVRWRRERFRDLHTLVIHYGNLLDCPLVPKDTIHRRLREQPDWSRDTHLPTKPGQLLKEMRGYRGTLRRLILDTDGETFLLPIGIENLNVDELASVTYASRRFSHTGITQNGGRKEPFAFRHLTEVKIYTVELDEDVLGFVYSYLEEFGGRLKVLHFHWQRQPDAVHHIERRVSLPLADILGLCPNLETLSTEPPDVLLASDCAAAETSRLKRLRIGSPMARDGAEALLDRTGLNWESGQWVWPVAGVRLQRDKEASDRAQAPPEPSVIDVSHPSAWD